MPGKTGLRQLDARPLYMQAADALMDLLREKQYGTGGRLPSEDALAAELGVSRSTIREAVTLLEREGLITRRHGVGTFVAGQANGSLMIGLEQLVSLSSLGAAMGCDVRTVQQSVERLDADSAVAAILGVETGAPLVNIRSVTAAGDTRIASFNVLLLPGVVDEDACRESGLSMLEFMLDKGDTLPLYTKSHLRIEAATSEVGDRLHLQPGTPVLHLIETYYSRHDRPLAYANNYLVTDRFDFFIVRRVAHMSLARR